jgi:hypothetical protein
MIIELSKTGPSILQQETEEGSTREVIVDGPIETELSQINENNGLYQNAPDLLAQSQSYESIYDRLEGSNVPPVTTQEEIKISDNFYDDIANVAYPIGPGRRLNTEGSKANERNSVYYIYVPENANDNVILTGNATNDTLHGPILEDPSSVSYLEILSSQDVPPTQPTDDDIYTLPDKPTPEYTNTDKGPDHLSYSYAATHALSLPNPVNGEFISTYNNRESDSAYSYSTTHQLVSPQSSNTNGTFKITSEYVNCQGSNSQPMNTQWTDKEHQYQNLLAGTTLLPPRGNSESSSNNIRPSWYRAHSHNPMPSKQEDDYFTSTEAWLSKSKQNSLLSKGVGDYTPIFARDMYTHDYTIPSSSIQRSSSASKAATIDTSNPVKYENQSMWLKNNKSNLYASLVQSDLEHDSTQYFIPNNFLKSSK